MKSRAQLRTAAKTVVVVVLAVLAWRKAASYSAVPAPGRPPIYADYGEVLLHGFAPERLDPSYYLPAATISSAVAYDHAPEASRLVLLSLALLALTLFAVGFLRKEPCPLSSVLLGALGWQLLSGDAQLQPAYAALLTLTAGLLVRRARKPTLASAAAVGLALGATLLFRSALAFLPPLLVVSERKSLAAKKNLPQLALLLVVPYLFLVPWWTMNAVVHREFVPFEHGEAHTNIVTGALGLVETIEGDWQGTLVDRSLDARHLAPVLAWASKEVAQHPLRYARAYLRRLWFVLSLNPLACLLSALAFCFLRHRAEFRALGLLCAYFVLIHCMMSVQENYFTPLWPLLVSMIAGAFLCRDAPPKNAASDAGLAGALALVLGACVFVEAKVVGFAAAAARRDPHSDAAMSEALAAAPDDAWLKFEKGYKELSAGRSAEAVSDIGAALSARPDRRDWQWRLAVAKAAAGDDAAIADWQLSASDGGDVRLDYLILKAGAELRRRRRDAALPLLKNALRIMDSESIQVREGATPLGGDALRRLRATAQGLPPSLALRLMPAPAHIAVLEELARMAPERVGFRLEQAAVAASSGDRARAIEALSQAERSRPADADLREIALRFQELKTYDRALAVLRELTARAPRSAQLRADLGVCEFLRGDKPAARADLEAAVSLDPDYIPAYQSLGVVLKETGRAIDARRIYERAMRSPAFPSAEPALQQAIREASR